LLSSYGANTYTYNVNGIRTSKSDGTLTKEYIVDNGRIVAEFWKQNGATTKSIYYVYNANGIAGFVYNGIPYVYQKNIFGDIVAIYNHAGGKVAGYRYNAYGECYIYNPQLDEMCNGATIAEINPFRYRGYYYDTETGLYYLQSRYYDPAMGRFINADTVDYLDPQTINGINLYAYALNNPVQYCDPTGHAVLTLATCLYGLYAVAIVLFVTGAIYVEKETHIVENIINQMIEGVEYVVDGINNWVAQSKSTGRGKDTGLLKKYPNTEKGNTALEEVMKEARKKGDTKLAMRIIKELKNRGWRNRKKNRGGPVKGFYWWLLLAKLLEGVFDEHQDL